MNDRVRRYGPYIGCFVLSLLTLFSLSEAWPATIFFFLTSVFGIAVESWDHYEKLVEWRRMGAKTEAEYVIKCKLAKDKLELAKKACAWCDAGIGKERGFEIESQLQALADSLLYLFDGMPKVKVHLITEPINDGYDWYEPNPFAPGLIKTIKAPRSLARGGLGHIYVKYDYFRSTSHADLRHTMKHEMTHCWIDWMGIKVMDAHGDAFQQKLHAVEAR